MQINTLRYFAAVAQHGSLREAAEALHVAQSALSRQILKLEEEFGVALLERHTRGVRLTPAGQTFLRYARDSLAQAEHVQSELAAFKGLRRGTVRIHAIESLVDAALPRAIGAFSQRYPGVVFDVTIEGTDHIIEAVRDVRTDIGLAFHPQVGQDIKAQFRVREPLVALVSPAHPIAGAARVSIGDVLGFPVALPMKHSGSRMLIDAACEQAGLFIAAALETNSVRLIVQFVRCSGGVTFLPRLAALEQLRARELIAIPVRDYLMNAATIDALVLASRKLPIAAEEFSRFLQRELQVQQDLEHEPACL